MSDGTIKQVRVDNWGIFFLQRLQQLFSKSEQCDLVLHFSTNEKIKVGLLLYYLDLINISFYADVPGTVLMLIYFQRSMACRCSVLYRRQRLQKLGFHLRECNI